MTDKNYKKLVMGQEAIVLMYGHVLQVELYEVTNDNVYFRVINPKSNEPKNGYFNRLEAERYMTIINSEN
jgi:hypothetical protein